MAQECWNKNHSPLPTLFTSSLCCLHCSWEGTSVQGLHPLKKDYPGQGRWCFTAWFFGEEQTDTHWRSCNHSLITPKSANPQPGMRLSAAVCRMSPASCRELGDFSLSDWDGGDEGFSSLKRENFSAGSLANLKPAAKLHHIGYFFFPRLQLLSSSLTNAP